MVCFAAISSSVSREHNFNGDGVEWMPRDLCMRETEGMNKCCNYNHILTSFSKIFQLTVDGRSSANVPPNCTHTFLDLAQTPANVEKRVGRGITQRFGEFSYITCNPWGMVAIMMMMMRERTAGKTTTQ